MQDNLSGKTYTWEDKTITFVKNCKIITPWVPGTYEWIDKYTVHATWYGYKHVLTFTPNFSEFTYTNSKKTLIKESLTEINIKSKIPSYHIDYKNKVSDLCLIAKSFKADKSSQRDNPGPEDGNHCHPYSLLYNDLFKKNRNDTFNLCEIGIAEGKSLCTWNEYFPNAQIYGFEKWQRWLDYWNTTYSDKTRVQVNEMDVRYNDSITVPFSKLNVMFDCIIDDSTHQFNDMIRIIRCSLPFLKPGGMMIIEDIQKFYDESWFYTELNEILNEFQTCFFVDLEHDRRNSGMVQNDKVLVLIKNGTCIFNYSLI